MLQSPGAMMDEEKLVAAVEPQPPSGDASVAAASPQPSEAKEPRVRGRKPKPEEIIRGMNAFQWVRGIALHNAALRLL